MGRNLFFFPPSPSCSLYHLIASDGSYDSFSNALGADIGALSSSAYSKALERKLSLLRDRAGADAEKKKPYAKAVETATQEPECDETDRPTSVSSTKLTAYINGLSNADLTVSVSMRDFLFAVANIKPSVTRSELDHYEALGEEFNDLIP